MLGTTSDTLNTMVNVDYPQGFNSSNSVIVGFNIRYSLNGAYYSNASEAFVTTTTAGTKIGIIISQDTGYLSQPFNILLEKL